MDSEEPIPIPNESLGQENNQARSPGDKHRKVPRDDREGYAKSEGWVIDASSYAKSQQKYSMHTSFSITIFVPLDFKRYNK